MIAPFTFVSSLAGLLLFSLLGPQSAFSAEVLWVEGSVKAGSQPLKVGDRIPLGTQLHSESDGAALIRLKDQSIIKLSGEASLQIKRESSPAEVELEKGSAFIQVKPSRAPLKSPKFLIRTRSAVLGVRGTQFFVAQENSSVFWACVQEGLIEVKGTETPEPIQIKAGQGVALKNGKLAESPRAYPWTQNLNWNFDSKLGSVRSPRIEFEPHWQD